MGTKLSVPLPCQPFNYQRAAAGGVKTRKKSRRNNKIKTLFKFSSSYHNFADNVMKITLIVSNQSSQSSVLSNCRCNHSSSSLYCETINQAKISHKGNSEENFKNEPQTCR